MDDEILLGCKGPEGDSNLDLRPVTELAHYDDDATAPDEGKDDDLKQADPRLAIDRPAAKNAVYEKRVKTTEGRTRPRQACNRVHQRSKDMHAGPLVVLSQEAKQEQLARALRGEKNEYSYQLMS